MSKNVAISTGAIDEIKDLMHKAFDICEKDTAERGIPWGLGFSLHSRGFRSHEDVVERIESILGSLKQYADRDRSDVCKKTSIVIELVRGFELANERDRPMRLAAKFLFAIDQVMQDN